MKNGCGENGGGFSNSDPGSDLPNKIMPPDLMIGTDPKVPISERYNWPAVFDWFEQAYGSPINIVDIFVFDSEGITTDKGVLADLHKADTETLQEVILLPEFLGYLSGNPDPTQGNANRTICVWLPENRDVIRAATSTEAHGKAAAHRSDYENTTPMRFRVNRGESFIWFVELNREWEPVLEDGLRHPVAAEYLLRPKVELLPQT